MKAVCRPQTCLKMIIRIRSTFIVNKSFQNWYCFIDMSPELAVSFYGMQAASGAYVRNHPVNKEWLKANNTFNHE